ncbi:hypothetical protein M9H77_21992 [Catharanthus roseus]|uniref:Uncharacterized protein n=1 Tax=Catharanthus roseus TaxID=4058 RepID=A0ACC0AR87_CATRO|nr:hypothetical protein M9H77_21992 [Catharanthus roseus]
MGNGLDGPNYGRTKRGERYRATYDGGRRSEKTRMQDRRGSYTHNENGYGDEFFGKRCYYEETTFEGDEEGVSSPKKSESEDRKKNREKENERTIEKLSKEIFEGKNEESMSEELKERECVSSHVVGPPMSSLLIEEDAPLNLMNQLVL